MRNMQNLKEKLPHTIMIIVAVIILILAAKMVAFGQNEQQINEITSSALNANPSNSNAFGLLIVGLAASLVYMAHQSKKKDAANAEKDNKIMAITHDFQKVLTDTIHGNTLALQSVNLAINANDDKIIAAMEKIITNNERHMTTVLKDILNSHEKNVKTMITDAMKEYSLKQ